jgi:hypothetical protein
VSEGPSNEGFIDPNARLLASVIPPPPPAFRQRVLQRLRGSRIDLRGVVDWSRSREGRSCFLVALAAAALAVVLHRSEPTSFARTTSAITREAQSASALFVKRESVRPAPRPLADAPTVPSPRKPIAASDTRLAAIADGVRSEPPEPSSEPEVGVSVPGGNPKREAQLRRGSARGERHASAAKKSRKKLEKRKAKRKAAARASARARRAKSKPTKASSPLRAWIASHSRDESSNSKQR